MRLQSYSQSYESYRKLRSKLRVQMAQINVLCLFRNFVTLNLYKKKK
nr:MAG TPA: hypothetical protein [Caudoviricetes sp.]